MPEGAHPRAHDHAKDTKDHGAKDHAAKDNGIKEGTRDNGRDSARARARDDGNDAESFRLAGDGIGRMGAAFVMPSMEIGLTMLEEMRELAQMGAEQLEENIRLLEEGWRDMSSCESAVDLSKAAGRFSYAYSKLLTNVSQRMAHLASETAARRLRANAAWGTQVMRQAASQASH